MNLGHQSSEASRNESNRSAQINRSEGKGTSRIQGKGQTIRSALDGTPARLQRIRSVRKFFKSSNFNRHFRKKHSLEEELDQPCAELEVLKQEEKRAQGKKL